MYCNRREDSQTDAIKDNSKLQPAVSKTALLASGPAHPLPPRGLRIPIVLANAPCAPRDAKNFKDTFTGSWDSEIVPHFGFPLHGQPYSAVWSLNWESKSLVFTVGTFKAVFFAALPDLLPHKVE